MLSTYPVVSYRHRLLLNFFGVVLLILGAIAFLNAYITWHLSSVVLYSAPAYGLLYMVAAYMFFTRQYWLIYVFAFNLSANLLLVGYHYYLVQELKVSWVVMLICNALLLWYLYTLRKGLRDSWQGRAALALAFILWLGTMYTINIR